MKKILFIQIILSLLLFSCGENAHQAGGPRGPMPLPVVEIPSKTVTGFSEYPVSIQGIVNSDVRAKVSGYITQVLVDEGEKVQKGQLLFRLETQSLSQEAEAAKANVEAAQVGVDQLKPLVEKDIISEVQLETAKAKLAQAKASYQSIMANIGYASIQSPIDGYVGAIPYRKGSLISPTSPKPLTTVSKTDKVYAYFAMNEADYLNFLLNAEGEGLQDKIKNFPPVKLRLANGDIYSEEGKIETVTAQVDPSTGTVSFRAVFPNPNHLLANGSSATIMIPKKYEDVPVVPEQSTYEQQGKIYVYKVQGDTLATPSIIEVKDRIQNLIITGNGLKAGDKIVAQGVGKLRGPTPIKPIPMPFDSIANSIEPVFQ
jgi:membrane fusion protein (multidrug efflux system)